MENITANSIEYFQNVTTKQFLLTLTWQKLVMGVVLYGIIVVTVVGNVMVLIAVKVDKKLQTIFNYYIVNLAITDIGVALTAMSFKATYTILDFWPFGEVLCAMWIFCDYGTTFVSVFTLILISTDRFWSVVWSLHYRKHRTKKKAIAAIVFVWAFMLVLWVPPWIVDRIKYSTPDVCYWDPSLNMEFVFIIAIVGQHGPYCVLIFCYIYVFVYMRTRTKVGNSTRVILRSQTSSKPWTTATTSDNHSELHKAIDTATEKSVISIGNDEVQPEMSRLQVPNNISETVNSREVVRATRERKVFVTLTYVIIAYAILWLPFHMVFDISIAYPMLVPEPVLNLAFWMAYFNSTINPFLYNFSSPEFKKAFKNILRRLKCV